MTSPHQPSGAADNAPEAAPASLFQELFEVIDEGYCLCEMIVDDAGRPVDYRFLEANPHFEEMTGLKDAVGRTALELVPDLEQEWVERYARAALGRERLRFELGSQAMGRWFDVFTMPVGSPGQFAIVFKDETARHQALLDLRQSEERYRELAEREHSASLRLQRALLPDELVADRHVEITAFYRAGSEGVAVGGDWYDSFRWPDGRVGVMVGDVVGHGIEAAAAMGRLRAAVGALAPHTGGSPSAMLSALSDCASGPDGCDYLTACCVVLDPASGDLRYSYAGHPYALLVGPTGVTTWLRGGTSPPLGSLLNDGDERRFTEVGCQVPPGSVVLLYSDGLIERRGRNMSDGFDRLSDHASGVALRGGDIAASLARELLADSASADDVVVVAMRYRGPS